MQCCIKVVSCCGLHLPCQPCVGHLHKHFLRSHLACSSGTPSGKKCRTEPAPQLGNSCTCLRSSGVPHAVERQGLLCSI